MNSETELRGEGRAQALLNTCVDLMADASHVRSLDAALAAACITMGLSMLYAHATAHTALRPHTLVVAATVLVLGILGLVEGLPVASTPFLRIAAAIALGVGFGLPSPGRSPPLLVSVLPWATAEVTNPVPVQPHPKGDLGLHADTAFQREREQLTTAEAIHVAREMAEHASRVKSNFLRVMSHELRTPITAMRLQVRMLERTNPVLSASSQIALAGLGRSTQRMLDLVDSVLEYARIESGRFTARADAFSLAALVLDAVSELRTHAEMKQVRVAILPVGSLPLLHSDARLVRLIVVNLLSNALRVTHQGAITVQLEAGDGVHRISLTDGGEDLLPNELSELFDPFADPRDIRRREGAGSGLGLALINDMVGALGGRIHVETGLSRGNTYRLTLPTQMAIQAQPVAAAAVGPLALSDGARTKAPT